MSDNRILVLPETSGVFEGRKGPPVSGPGWKDEAQVLGGARQGFESIANRPPLLPRSVETADSTPGKAGRAEKVTFPSVADLVEKMLSPSAPTGVTS